MNMSGADPEGRSGRGEPGSGPSYGTDKFLTSGRNKIQFSLRRIDLSAGVPVAGTASRRCALRGVIGEVPLALAIEEKYDQVRQLIAMGKERGYLLYDEVNDILPAGSAFVGRDRRFALHLRALRNRYLRRPCRAQKPPAPAADPARPKPLKSNPRRTPGRRRERTGPHAGDAGKDERSGADVPARNGHRAAAHARGRSGHRQAHRARAIARAQDDHALADHPEGIADHRRRPPQGHALDQGNRPVRRRGADRRKDRKQDQEDAARSSTKIAKLLSGAA